MTSRVTAELLQELEEAELKAWDSLARYKFMMFGYWAGVWVHLNRIARVKRPSPWKVIVLLAREHLRTLRQRAPATPAANLFEDKAA